MPVSSSFFNSIQLTELTLRVRDLKSTRAFYEDMLGLRVTMESESRVALSASETEPALIVLEHAPDAPAQAKGTAGLFHVAILYPSRADLGRAAQNLIDKKVAFGTGDHGVSEALYLDDPEGNGVELYADRTVNEWPPAQEDGQVAMYTTAVDMKSLLNAGAEEIGPLMPPQTRIGHIHLSVSDLANVRAFYVDVLGFAIRQSSYTGALFLGRDGYHHHIGANVWRSNRPAIAGSLGLANVTMQFTHGDELQRVVTLIEKKGRLAIRRDRSARVHDLDGLELTLRLANRAD
jgi:catechol 2,3-dioxygenase